MRKLVLLSAFLFSIILCNAQQTFHDFTVISITGDTVPLTQYYGKKVLVVNTASFCGYTYQFGMLQALDSTYSNNNFEVVGFPSNDFGGQDPYADSTIAAFCSNNYGVTFQMMKKISVTAVDTADVYKWLQRQDLNGVANAPVTWNFNKFCIDEAGHWVHHFDSWVTPFDTAITNWILSPSVTGLSHHQPGKQLSVIADNEQQSLSITTESNFTGPLRICLYNLQGQLITTIYDAPVNGSVQINYPTLSLQKGMYLIRSIAGTESNTVKVVIK
jgi:glutathione peroxidase